MYHYIRYLSINIHQEWQPIVFNCFLQAHLKQGDRGSALGVLEKLRELDAEMAAKLQERIEAK